MGWPEMVWGWIAAGLALAVVGLFAAGFVMGWRRASGKLRAGMKEHQRRSRLTLGGRFAEQMAPYLDGFRYDPTEARFLGSPIDFVVFPGLATGEPREIVFVEVKRGGSGLDRGQRRLRDLVASARSPRIRFETIRVLRDLDEGSDA